MGLTYIEVSLYNTAFPSGRDVEGGDKVHPHPDPLPSREREYYEFSLPWREGVRGRGKCHPHPSRERSFMERCRDCDIAEQLLGMVWTK
jgi:hypothetical protein